MTQIKKLNLGCVLSPKDKRDLKAETLIVRSPLSELPSSVFNPVVISYQNGVGACTGYSGATMKSGLEFKETGKLVKQSGRWVYAYNKLEDGIPNDEGSYSRQSVKTLAKVGVPKESLCPNEPHTNWKFYKDTQDFTLEAQDDADIKRIEGYGQVSLGTLFSHLNKYGFLIMSVPWNVGDHNPTNSVMHNTGESYGYHSICSDGYLSAQSELEAEDKLKWLVNNNKTYADTNKLKETDKVFHIMANSFAEGWGYKGFALMQMYPAVHPYNEAWTVLSDLPNDWRKPPADPSRRYDQPRTWQSFLYEQKCAFNPWLISKIKRLPTNKEITKLAYGYWDWFSIYDTNRFEYPYTEWLTKIQWATLKLEATGNVGSDIIKWRNENKINK